jgi:hypothetical protein
MIVVLGLLLMCHGADRDKGCVDDCDGGGWVVVLKAVLIIVTMMAG